MLTAFRTDIIGSRHPLLVTDIFCDFLRTQLEQRTTPLLAVANNVLEGTLLFEEGNCWGSESRQGEMIMMNRQRKDSLERGLTYFLALVIPSLEISQ